ncbi:MAG TPA: dihydroorotate dehydrogenase-like protein [Bryobacteraceae bacterium]|jgi:dihydroorotate dehydrogenase (fumarate)|nr:dihydroorotate dehydrogenase-like protein [Bryobacteraceae bacterium]
MTDLSTEYLGLQLRSPLVVSASPLAKDLSNLRRMEEAGAAAIVLQSLFEEQITAEEESLDRFLTQGTDSYAEALSYFPNLRSYGMGPDAYLEHVRKAKQAVSIPIIGSLNGVSSGGWIRYARLIQQAGADALELNIYFLPTSLEIEGREIEASYCDLLEAVKSKVHIPVAVKLAPYFTSMTNMAARLDRAGADALVLFNRFYQPDFDLEALEVTPSLTLSSSDELRLRLHWVALLSRAVRCELAITGGVHTHEDVLKGIMAGANVVMLTSALLKHGISYLRELEASVVEWIDKHEYESIRQMRGSMNAAAVAEPAAFERANYIKVLGSYRA